VSLIRQAYQAGQLHRIKDKQEVKSVLNTVMKKDWVIYIKPYLKKPHPGGLSLEQVQFTLRKPF